MKGAAHCHQTKRGSCFAQIVNRTVKDGWKRQAKERPDQTCQDSQDNGVGCNSL